MAATPQLWLRAEKKAHERRAALTPTTARALIDAGFEIFVERDDGGRIFDDAEYEKAGCTLVANGSWASAPASVPIIGLKELPESAAPIAHTHIQFAHCYKRQAGWSAVLARFARGGGTLYDIEFLQDARGRRVAAFGFHAGFAGAAAGALAHAAQKGGGRLGALTPYADEGAMISGVKAALGGSGRGARALVIGALGRCGRGAVDLLRKIGLEEDDIVKWDMAETARGGPFEEILDVDIFVNCIYLAAAIPPFLTRETVRAAGARRRLGVIVDVSCDTTNPFNPIPVYSVNTTFPAPTVDVDIGRCSRWCARRPEYPALTVVSIDHLPTLLPREASEQFSADLLPSLLEFPQRGEKQVWVDAEKLFKEKLAEAVEEEKLQL
ncbi:saccharopine dehydrogenase [Phellopilus nigrolimitatus]|nr:saccharopine dehydrogenase [Phellopilus nigrolimitatus]